jgi:hypothetical protein
VQVALYSSVCVCVYSTPFYLLFTEYAHTGSCFSHFSFLSLSLFFTHIHTHILCCLGCIFLAKKKLREREGKFTLCDRGRVKKSFNCLPNASKCHALYCCSFHYNFCFYSVFFFETQNLMKLFLFAILPKVQKKRRKKKNNFACICCLLYALFFIQLCYHL